MPCKYHNLKIPLIFTVKIYKILLWKMRKMLLNIYKKEESNIKKKIFQFYKKIFLYKNNEKRIYLDRWCIS